MRTLTRSQVIEDLRVELLKLVDDEHSLCLVAARRGLFCNGFGRWERGELERRFPWILEREPRPTTDEIACQANHWQLGAQDVRAGRLPCDVEGGPSTLPCSGWNEFYEADLARFYLEMRGEEVRVVPDGLQPERAEDAAR